MSASCEASGRRVDTVSLRITGALAAAVLSLATVIQDWFLFPAIGDTLFLPALCGVLYGLAFAAIGLVTRRARVIPRAQTIAVITLACPLAGAIMWSAAAGDVVCTLIAYALFSLGRASALVALALALHRLGPGEVMGSIATGMAIAYFIAALAPQALGTFALGIYAIAPFVGCLCAYPGLKRYRERFRPDSTPRDLSVTNPESFPHPFNVIFGCIAIFEIGFGLFQPGLSAVTLAGEAAACCIALAILVRLPLEHGTGRVDRLFDIAAVLFIAAVLGTGVPSPILQAIASVTGTLGPQLFRAITWALITSMIARNPAGAVEFATMGFGISAVAAGIGLALRELPHVMASDDIQVVYFAIPLALFAFLWLAVRKLSFSEIIARIRAVEPLEHHTAQPDEIESSCAHVAERFQLTDREREVLVLLARGRNATVIQDKLGIARSTTKTHVSHVYQKLGVHTQQEVIDLVEREPARDRRLADTIG